MPGCNIKIKFMRNSDGFCLLGTTKVAKLKIFQLELLIKRLTIEETLLERLESTLSTKPVILYLSIWIDSKLVCMDSSM